MNDNSFLVSAPGKVILFGEHGVVYGTPAIAAALNLRGYLLVTPSENPDIIELNFPDIELHHQWNRNELPWDELQKLIVFEDGKPVVNKELVPDIIELLSGHLLHVNSKMHYTACRTFLYLYSHICSRETKGRKFTIRSAVPIGAGLGSSACISVCLATALGIVAGYISRATYKIDEHVTEYDPALDFINNWSLVGEKCFHGNPSGIDNAVATFGGGVFFQRASKREEAPKMHNMRAFPPLPLLLTNTKVPRSTADLVGKVGRLYKNYHKCTEPILSSLEQIVVQAHNIMANSYFSETERSTLHDLVEMNHGLLVSLGVSHPALERVRMISDEYRIGSTKLTGAGGGGCAITLVTEGVVSSQLEKAIIDFEAEGFETIETMLGGRGVAFMSVEDVPSEEKEAFSVRKFCDIRERREMTEILSNKKHQYWKYW